MAFIKYKFVSKLLFMGVAGLEPRTHFFYIFDYQFFILNLGNASELSDLNGYHSHRLFIASN